MRGEKYLTPCPVYCKGRQPIKTDWTRFEKLYAKWKDGELTAVAMQRELGLGARTFYRRVAEYEGKCGIIYPTGTPEDEQL